MEDEIIQINTNPTPTGTIEVEPVVIDRPMSPIERIMAGNIDGRPIHTWNGKMDSLLIALAKTLKMLTKDKLSSGEKKKAFDLLEQITTDDIKKACDDASQKTIKALMSFEDNTQPKIKAPTIHPNATDQISPQASKDFSNRINNGYFASNAKNTVKMKDVLSAVKDVVEWYKITETGAKNLLRRSIREPCRTFFENLESSGASLERIFSSLQDHFNQSMSSTEASQKLRVLLSQPIQDLDSFLADLLNYSICSARDLPASQQNKAGYLLATGYLNSYLARQYPHLFSLLRHDINALQSANQGEYPETFLTMMRVLCLHRESLQAQGRKNPNKISEIADDFVANGDSRQIQESQAGQIGPVVNPPTSQDIREIIRDEIRQNQTNVPLQQVTTEKQDAGQGNMKNMLQEIVQEVLVPQMSMMSMEPRYESAPLPSDHYLMQINDYIQANNAPWVRNLAMPNTGPPPMRPGFSNPGANGMPGGYRPRWSPQIMQRPQGFVPNSQYYGQSFGQPRMQGQSPAMQGQVPMNQGKTGETRRLHFPEEVYSKYFGDGNKCFLCALPGHAFRQCFVFGPGQKVAAQPCPTCDKQNIKAFHEDCNGKCVAAHKGFNQSKEAVNQWNQGNASTQANAGDVAKVNEIGCYFNGEMGFNPAEMPVYSPEEDYWPKNE